MITAFFVSLWAKVWKWLVLLGTVLVAIGAIFLKGRSSGKASQDAKVQEAEQHAQVAEQQATILESRHDTDTQVQALPEAPAQSVATADPATAAGRLSAWTRD